MELYDDSDFREEQKKSKLPMILGICIVLLIILTMLIVGLIFYLKGTIMTITLDGQAFNELENMMVVNDEEIYIPIRQIAPYFQYEAFAGDYINKSEDKTKCYVTCEYEAVQFVLDSNIITKMPDNSEYEYIELENNTIQIDNELYTTIDGIKNAFNVEFVHDIDKNSIVIYTMDYLVNYYAINVNKLEEYEATFSDKKAIFKDMLVVEQNNKYGVVQASTGKSILESKYDQIEYISSTSEFLVKSNNKYGIISENAEIKIKLVYDEIKSIDSQKGLYLVKTNGVYGVIDNEENKIIDMEYNEIGIPNYSSFTKNGVENQYIILDELIPVKKNDLWGFFNIEGEKITDIKYAEIGCKESKEENSYPVLMIPGYKAVVVGNNKKYNVIGFDGVEKAAADIIESIYLKNDITTGKNTYYMTYNNKVADVEEWLSKIQ